MTQFSIQAHTDVMARLATAPSAGEVHIQPLRLGGYLRDGGAYFAVRAPQAEQVWVSLFTPDPDSGELEEVAYRLHAFMGTWAGFVPDVPEGTLYGYRTLGLWAPERGIRYNPAKLLLDPYARAIGRCPQLHSALYPHCVDEDLEPLKPLAICNEDSAPYAALGALIPASAAAITHPNTPWRDTVIYEAHVKGLTALREDIPAELRGTYAGAAHPAIVSYLKELNISAVEFLPIHAHMPEPFLTRKGLKNYWGYNTLNYFSPEPSYATQAARDAGPAAVVEEVREMVRAYHEAGIEVILDVVYNHTCEGGTNGTMLSWRGLEAGYYLARPDDPSQFADMTGCGNTLDFRRPDVVKMALDSLRYWVEEIGVDGFRFDLAVTLGRNENHFDSNHPFFMGLYCDPVLSNAKIINEPWDLGPNGWQTGRFIYSTADWNDHFRDTTRTFWISQVREELAGRGGGDLRDIATRLSGSADLFDHGRTLGGRGVFASINFITAHDGFTLRDLVSFDNKHNEVNGEGNRDGSATNRSWNHGHEGIGGESQDGQAGEYLRERLMSLPEGAADFSSTLAFLSDCFVSQVPSQVHARRERTLRNLLATLLISAGTPMIVAGDEAGRTQLGNNNCYCQDNPLSWVNWQRSPWQEDLRTTTAFLISLRRSFSALRPEQFFSAGSTDEAGVEDLTWLAPSGENVEQNMWFDPHARCIQMLRSGRESKPDVLFVMNGGAREVPLRLARGHEKAWFRLWDSTFPRPLSGDFPCYSPGALTSIDGLSIQIYATALPDTPA